MKTNKKEWLKALDELEQKWNHAFSSGERGEVWGACPLCSVENDTQDRCNKCPFEKCYPDEYCSKTKAYILKCKDPLRAFRRRLKKMRDYVRGLK